MFAFGLALVVLALAVHLYRQYWFSRSLPRVRGVESGGETFVVGATAITVLRPDADPVRTIVCMPGFLEDSSYFLDLYAGRGYELVLVNNADYHSPFSVDGAKALEWQPNPFPVGTIEHDAFYVARAVRDLASARDVVIHGHSRGGAVALETGRQFASVFTRPDREVSVLLEAAVVPQGAPAGGFPNPVVAAFMTYFIPIVFGFLRNVSRDVLVRMPMMKPVNELKIRRLQTLFVHPKRYSTCVTNLRDIWHWQQSRGYDAYRACPPGRLLVGERDDVLDTETMRTSGEAGARENPGMRVVQTKGTNHFISLENPDAVYGALAELAAVKPSA